MRAGGKGDRKGPGVDPGWGCGSQETWTQGEDMGTSRRGGVTGKESVDA